jgi:hypothetical protein
MPHAVDFTTRYDLHMLAPVLSNGYVLLGDISRYVSVSGKRITDVQIMPTGLIVQVVGAPGESVVIAALKPPQLIVVTATATIPASGITSVHL